jgi:hypothetical protein
MRKPQRAPLAKRWFNRDRQKECGGRLKFAGQVDQAFRPSCLTCESNAQNHVEDASHKANYPRRDKERNYFRARFSSMFKDLLQQQTRRSNQRKIAASLQPGAACGIQNS